MFALIDVKYALLSFLLYFITTGRWENDERNGQGTYHYINGDVYEGEWKDNKRQGKGIYKCAATKLKVCHPQILTLLSPSINMYVLLTVLHIFVMVLVGRIWLKN